MRSNKAKKSQEKGENMGIIFFKGLIMGVADIIPGVSGGTMALVMGIYEKLIKAIGSIGNVNFKEIHDRGLFKAMVNSNTRFLFALGCGILTSVFFLSGVIREINEAEPVLFWSFFMGLIVASVFIMFFEIKSWSVLKVLVLIVSTAGSVYLMQLELPVRELNPLFYFISGLCASCAMILPGISGAFILLLLGAYFPVLEAIKHFDIEILGTLLGGVVTGLIFFTRVLKLLFSVAKTYIILILNGLILGTLDKLWPWKVVSQTRVTSRGAEVPLTYKNVSPMLYEGDTRAIFAVVAFCVGMLLVILASSVARRRDKIAKKKAVEALKDSSEAYMYDEQEVLEHTGNTVLDDGLKAENKDDAVVENDVIGLDNEVQDQEKPTSIVDDPAQHKEGEDDDPNKEKAS